jgi:hypothetical protein
VPPFLSVTIQLTQPITDRDAVGTLIRARVVSDVVHKGGIVLPRGSPVRGRIRRLERFDDEGTYAVGLEFTEVEANGVPLRFYAELLQLDRRPDLRKMVSEKITVSAGQHTQVITLPLLPGVALFFVRGKSFTLPEGFRMTWRTRGLLR